MRKKTMIQEPPLKDYDQMDRDVLTEQLRFLTDGEIQEVLKYEKESQNRKEILDSIEAEIALRNRHPAR